MAESPCIFVRGGGGQLYLSQSNLEREEGSSEGTARSEREQLPRMKAPLNNSIRGRMARKVLVPLARVLVRLVRSDLSTKLSSITAVKT